VWVAGLNNANGLGDFSGTVGSTPKMVTLGDHKDVFYAAKDMNSSFIELPCCSMLYTGFFKLISFNFLSTSVPESFFEVCIL
jgi:hypothetical protein